MKPEKKPDMLLGLDLAGAVLAVVGWLGVLLLWLFTVPTADARWLFFMLGLSALTGTLVPIVRHLNRRFGRAPAPAHVLLRRALWPALLGAVCAWLQIARTLTWEIAALLAAIFIFIEWLLEVRERSRWDPDSGR